MSQEGGKSGAVGVIAMVVLVGLSGLLGCDLVPGVADRNADRDAIRERQRQEADDARRATDEAARVAAEKQKVRTGAFLDTSDLVYYDKGFINDYRQLVGVSVLNRSKYPVMNLSGDVEWLNDGGARIASMPFELKGSIAAGDTKKFAAPDGTLSGRRRANCRPLPWVWPWTPTKGKCERSLTRRTASPRVNNDELLTHLRIGPQTTAAIRGLPLPNEAANNARGIHLR